MNHVTNPVIFIPDYLYAAGNSLAKQFYHQRNFNLHYNPVRLPVRFPSALYGRDWYNKPASSGGFLYITAN
jgi:hypothetical protein